MVYLIGWDYSDYLYIFFFEGIVIIFLFMKILKKKILQSLNNNKVYYYSIFLLSLILTTIAMIITFGICQKIYGITMYRNNKYEVVEGIVENVDEIYANNSYIIRGVHFSINDIDFTINNGILNAGYSYGDEFIIRSNDFLKVYYIKPSSGKDASFILRIDNIMK